MKYIEELERMLKAPDFSIRIEIITSDDDKKIVKLTFNNDLYSMSVDQYIIFRKWANKKLEAQGVRIKEKDSLSLFFYIESETDYLDYINNLEFEYTEGNPKPYPVKYFIYKCDNYHQSILIISKLLEYRQKTIKNIKDLYESSNNDDLFNQIKKDHPDFVRDILTEDGEKIFLEKYFSNNYMFKFWKLDPQSSYSVFGMEEYDDDFYEFATRELDTLIEEGRWEEFTSDIHDDGAAAILFKDNSKKIKTFKDFY